MTKRILVVTAVEKEHDAIVDGLRGLRAADLDGGEASVRVVVSGAGRVNAACATTEALLWERVDLVISAGVAGALPGADPPQIGVVVVAERCVYAEEGLLTPEGFCDMRGLGFPLGPFAGNEVPVEEESLARLRRLFRAGRIATVATCSGVNHAAAEIAHRTGAIAEAMEGAAVVHAALRLGIAGIELRAISNTTGDRAAQQWNLALALDRLGEAVADAVRTVLCIQR